MEGMRVKWAFSQAPEFAASRKGSPRIWVRQPISNSPHQLLAMEPRVRSGKKPRHCLLPSAASHAGPSFAGPQRPCTPPTRPHSTRFFPLRHHLGYYEQWATGTATAPQRGNCPCEPTYSIIPSACPGIHPPHDSPGLLRNC